MLDQVQHDDFLREHHYLPHLQLSSLPLLLQSLIVPIYAGGSFIMIISLALLLEWWLGDPVNRWHPVAWFGHWATWWESLFYFDHIMVGAWVWLLVVAPMLYGISLLYVQLGWPFGVLLLWLSIGWRSLFTHVHAVLDAPSLDQARLAVSTIVSRDTTAMQREDTSRAALESLAENSSDAVVAPLFWFVVAGPVGAATYRMINTLDAMWGYHNLRYENFGKTAALMDDVANWLPARITALLLLFVGRWSPWRVVKQHADSHTSPNAGWPEAALAFAAEIRLGGPVQRGGLEELRPWYGTSAQPLTPETNQHAMTIVHHTLLLAAAIAVLLSIVF